MGKRALLELLDARAADAIAAFWAATPTASESLLYGHRATDYTVNPGLRERALAWQERRAPSLYENPACPMSLVLADALVPSVEVPRG